MPRLLLRFLWFAAVAASLVTGGRELSSQLAALPRTPFTPRATSDLYLASLAIDHPAESFRQAFSTVPGDEAVVFAGLPDDPRYIQTLYTASFLAFPRQVGGLGCPAGGGDGYAVVPLDAGQEISAVVFFQLAPASSGAQTLAPGVSLLRIPAREASTTWNSLCSSPLPPAS